MEATECDERQSRGQAEESKGREVERKDAPRAWETKVKARLGQRSEGRKWAVSAT